MLWRVMFFLALAAGVWAGTKVGLVYDKNTGELLRIVVPDNDLELNRHQGAEEAIAVIDKSEYRSMTLPQLTATVQATSGKVPPPVERLAISDQTGLVVGIVHDVLSRKTVSPGFSVRVSTFADVNGKYVGGVYSPPATPSTTTVKTSELSR